jgi:hypothetical protein
MGDILLALYEGEFEGVRKLDQYMLNMYLNSLNNYFSEPYNMMDESCSAYANPRLARALYRRVMEGMGMGTNQSPEQQGLNALKMMANIFKDARQTGGSNIQRRVMEREDVKSSGTKDGVKLAQNYGCDSPLFKQLYANIEAYVYDENPRFVTGLAGFKSECQNYSQSQGSPAEKAKEICACFTDKFARQKVSDSDVEWLRKNYDQGQNFNRVVKQYDGLTRKIASCLM